MPKSMSEFLAMMDDHLWFRMLVCFLPPLIIVKLIGYFDNGLLLNKAPTAVLLIGVALYVFWERVRDWMTPAEADAEEDTQVFEPSSTPGGVVTEPQGRFQVEMLAELRGLCQESERESERLIAVEVAINPQISYLEATRRAIVRKRVL